MLVFKRGKTLNSILVSTKLRKLPGTQCHTSEVDLNSTLEILKEMQKLATDPDMVVPCSRRECFCCPVIQRGSSVTGFSTKSTIPVATKLSCISSHVIYVITCTRCHLQYVGQTGQKLSCRLNNHRSTIKRQIHTAVGLHFNEPAHSIRDLQIMPIIDITGLDSLSCNHLERETIKTLGTAYPKGLNFHPAACHS
jgi:GIY-YIG catalytic domain